MAETFETASRPRRTGWMLPVILLILMFAIPSVAGGTIVNPEQIPEFIKSVLMQTWFVLDTESWWMGILHMSLLVIAGFLTITSWRKPRT